MKSKLLGVNANSNDEQQHANKEMNGEMGQKRTGANSTSNDCSGRAGTSNDDGSSIHTTTKTTTTDYQQLQDERTGDDLDPIEQWRKQQDYLQKKQQEPQHIIKEVCIFLKNRSWKKKLMTLIAIGSVIPIILDIFILRSGHLRSFFTTYLEWMTYHRLLGSLAYVFILVLTSLIFIPPSILIFAAGFTFTSLFGKIGILIALLTSYVGCTIGGVIGFVRARYMTRDLIEILMRRYPTIHAVDKAIVRNSLRVMILMRLNCLIPFGVLNYVFGITGVPWDTFVISMVGVLPWQLFLICLGASSATVYDTNSGEEEDEGVHLIRILLSSMGVAFGFIGLAITWKFAKKELQREVLDPATADATWNNIDSGGDLHATDYLRSMYFGDDQSYRSDNAIEVLQQQRNGIVQVGDYLHTNEAWVDDMRVSSYQQKLTWNEIMLDDFS
jgi:uncharacterized membrane protein YdjX (TVP38/TMEM64 family)